jgi:hypothetical protein
MPEFTRQTEGAAHQLSVEDDADADAFRDGDGHQVADALGLTPEPEFGKGAGIRLVFEFDRKPSEGFQARFQAFLLPTQVGSEHHPLRKRIHPARQADSDPFVRKLGIGLPQTVDSLRNVREKLIRAGRGRHGFPGQKMSVQAGQRHVRQAGTHVDADDAGAICVEMEEPRFSAPLRLPDRPLPEPPLGQELLGDDRNGASLQSGVTGQIRAGNGLMLADQIEHDATVDVTRRLARCNLEVA